LFSNEVRLWYTAGSNRLGNRLQFKFHKTDDKINYEEAKEKYGLNVKVTATRNNCIE